MSEISPLLSEVNPQQLEKIASAKAHGIRIETSWEELSEQAQELLHQLYSWPQERLEELFDSATAQPFTSAARTLDAASQWMPARDKSDRAQQKRTALCAALSYAALGNFPSASAVLKRAFPTLRPTSTSQAVLMAVAAPALLEEIERHNAHDESATPFFESLRCFLKSGQDLEVAQSAFQQRRIEGKDDLSGLGAICLQQIFTLSTAHVLRDKTSLSDAYIRRLASHVPLLMPPQWRVLQEGLLQEGLLQDGNAIVSLPPGTGKTLLGELCLMHSLDTKPGLGVFLAPYVALGRQVARRLEKHLPPTVRVCRALAGGELPDFQPHQRTEILVATPEKLDGLLRAQPHLLKHLKIVICDEAHLIGGDARGARLEGLLTRLRLQQSSGHSLRLVLLSAALGQSSSLCKWIEARVFAHDWRPTAQRIALWTGDGRLTWKDEALAHDAYALPMSWPNAHITPSDHWPAVERQTPLLHANAAFLARHLNESLGGAVLCVCATRRGTRHMAQALAHFFSPREPYGALAQAIDIIEKRHRILWPLADALRRGVAWHNASLPQEVRSLIEQALEEGGLEAIAATT
ncbi:MAG TPA: DEAD/DEAH box helicase, partial [Abditibacteriaceae bacterium]